MKKTILIIACVLLLTVNAFATEASDDSNSIDMQAITNSYYCNDFENSTKLRNDNPFQVDYSTVVKQYEISNNMSSDDEIDVFLLSIGDQSLFEMSQSNGKYYAINNYKNKISSTILDENGGFMQSFDGDAGEIFALPDQTYLERNISSLNVSQIDARLLIIPNFSTGVLFSDGSQELYYTLSCVDPGFVNVTLSSKAIAEVVDRNRSAIVPADLDFTINEDGVVIPDVGGNETVEQNDITGNIILIFIGIGSICIIGLIVIRSKSGEKT